MTTSEFREQFFTLVDSTSSIVITSHFSPDDDSIASVLSVFTTLTARYPNKNIRIIYTGQSVDRYKVFHNFEKIEWVDDIANHVEQHDLLIALDGNQYSRFSKLPEKLQQVERSVIIDHHGSVPDISTLSYVDPASSSTSELVYHLLIEGESFSKEVAEHLLCGILGDTGNFTYISPDQTDVLVFAKQLIQKVGIRIEEFRARYGGIPKKVMPLLQELVKNMEYKSITNWPDFQYSYVTRECMQDGSYTDEDMSAASHIFMSQYLKRVEGYGWGFVVTPRSDNQCRISMRSLPDSVNVRDLQERLGTGSGHNRAAGGAFKDIADSKECVAEVFQFMQNNKPVLG